MQSFPEIVIFATQPARFLRQVRILISMFFMIAASAAAAETVSVPFKEGFIGTIGSSNRQALNIRTFAALGIQASLVQQNSSTGQFESPTGNDIPVELVLMQGSNTFTIPGTISWKLKQTGKLVIFGFTPDATQATYSDINLSIPNSGGQTFALTSSSNYGVVKISTSLAAIGIVDGQADVSGSNDPVALSELNDYLDEVGTQRPFGPITVDTQTVWATLQSGSYVAQPTLTGEACLVTASTDANVGTETINVLVDGVQYSNVSYTDQGDNTIGSTTCDTDALDGVTIKAVTWSVDLSAQSPAQSVVPGTYSVTATIVTETPFYNSLSDSTSDELTVVQAQPELTVSKTAVLDKTVAGATGSVDIGDVISYTISIENTGNVAVSAPTALTDTLTAAGASSLTPAYSSGNSNSNSMIDVGETWVYTASYALVAGDLTTGEVGNIVEVSATPETGGSLTVQSSPTGNKTSTGTKTITTFSALSALTVSKTAVLDTETVGGSGDTTVNVGDRVTYTVTVTNTGNTTLSDVSVSDVLSRVDSTDTLTTVASTTATPGLLGTPFDSDNSTSGAAMAPNESWTYTYVYTLTQADIDAGRLSNTATATSGPLSVDSSAAGNTGSSASAAPAGTPTVTSLTQAAEMTVRKTVDTAVSGATYLTGGNAAVVDQDTNGKLSAGDRVYFTITARNTGNVTLSGVGLTDALKTREATPSALSVTSGPTLVSDTGTPSDATLDVGDVWTFSGYYALTQSDIDLGVGIQNLATFEATKPDGTTLSV
jgi:uncharacterized repeat protein (TIGR01451 family)